jgi:uncharacterized membrane protein
MDAPHMNPEPRTNRREQVLRLLLAVAMVAVGVLHFVAPEGFVRIVPAMLPAPLALVYVSGALEIAGGVGLLVRPLRRVAAYGLIALYVAVFPANVNMAIHRIPLSGTTPPPAWILWLRLPFQAVFIAWAYRVRK